MFELIFNYFGQISQEESGVISHKQLGNWPHGHSSALQHLKVLKKAAPAKAVECPGCEEACLMPVNVYPAQDGRPALLFIACDKREDTGRIRIEPADLEQWQIDLDRFVSLIATALGTGHAPDEIIPNQAFYLGPLIINRKRRSVFFAVNGEILIFARKAGQFEQFPHPVFLLADCQHETQKIKQGPILQLQQLLIFSDNNSLAFDMETLEYSISLYDTQQTGVSGPVAKSVDENVFRKDGQKWVLRFNGGTEMFFNDNKGFLYISYLLGAPDTEFHSQRLLAAANKTIVEDIFGTCGVQSVEDQTTRGSESDSESETMATLSTDSASSDPVLDKKALENYKDQMRILKKDIEEAENGKDFHRKETLEKEYGWLRKEIIAASGIGEKTREMADEPEKARKSVSAAYRRAMKIIQKESSPLYSHFKKFIQMGEYCKYQPEDKIFWKIDKK